MGIPHSKHTVCVSACVCVCLCACIRFYTAVTQGNETLHSTVKEPCRDNDMWLSIWKATRLTDELENCYCCVDQCAVF